jgi:hypothetical protein
LGARTKLSAAAAKVKAQSTLGRPLSCGFDEGDEISRDGSVERRDDDSIKIELSFDDGDDTVLTARRQ